MKVHRLSSLAATLAVVLLMSASSCVSFAFAIGSSDPESSNLPALVLVLAASTCTACIGFGARREQPLVSLVVVRIGAALLSIPFVWATMLFWDVVSLPQFAFRVVATFSGGFAALSVLGVMEFRRVRQRSVRTSLVILTAAVPVAVCFARLVFLEAS